MQSLLQLRNQQLHQQVLVQASSKQSELHRGLEKIEKQLSKQLRNLELDLQRKQVGKAEGEQGCYGALG